MNALSIRPDTEGERSGSGVEQKAVVKVPHMEFLMELFCRNDMIALQMIV